jgi:AcrR family transcriptional regulator
MPHPAPRPASGAEPAARRRSTAARLFDAAITEFARHGYQGATVRAICQRAGANTAAVNYHFGGKEQLYAQVLEHIFRAPRETRAALRPDLAAAPAAERLREFILNFFHEVYGCVDDRNQCGDLASIFIMEMAHPSPALARIIDTYILPDSRRLTDIVAELLAPARPRIWCATLRAPWWPRCCTLQYRPDHRPAGARIPARSRAAGGPGRPGLPPSLLGGLESLARQHPNHQP